MIVSWLRLRCQARKEHTRRQDLIALANALPNGGQIYEAHSDGTWIRLAVIRVGEDRDNG